MPLARGAQHFVDGRDHHDVADAVARQLEARTGVGAVERDIDALDRPQPAEDRVDISPRRQVDGRERSERTVMRQSGSWSSEQVELSQVTLTVKDRDSVKPAGEVVSTSMDLPSSRTCIPARTLARAACSSVARMPRP